MTLNRSFRCFRPTTAPDARKFVHILFQELDSLTDWFIGGQPRGLEPHGTVPHVFLDVFYPYAAAPPNAKRQLHRALNDALVRVILGDTAPTDALRGWSIIVSLVNTRTLAISGSYRVVVAHFRIYAM